VNVGVSLPTAIAAASRNPLAMLGVSDRGRIAVGQRADLVELDDDLRVRRVMRGGTWFEGASA
jgi:N-acetylglucosamine-6-phosphate deacetylase